MPSDIPVIILAAGRGERAGQAEGPKQYRMVGGKPVIACTLEAFTDHPAVGKIIVAIHPDDESLFHAATQDHADRVTFVHGGATRQASTRLALEALAEGFPKFVMIHDAARPFVDAGLISRVAAALNGAEAVLPALPVSDTIKRADEDLNVLETVPREDLHAAQTPQAFNYQRIRYAHRLAAEEGLDAFTDDAAIAAWAGVAVRIVPGAVDNIKLTWARDIAMADQRLQISATFPDVRTGNGYDVHSFEAGDAVWLCGVSIPHHKKLSGHSDADVGLHALTDALLATCGAGDIGTHFPPSDPQWRGASSKIFVEHAAKIVRENGGRIANADVTLICEEPKVGPNRHAMVTAMAAMLGIDPKRVSVKATTNERLGFIGRSEGIAAIATASVVYPGSLEE
ncbi:bifunctional 2-C-methyl-D-erythritol 4-phosphate cytidylyltransferase/2-C-methyl-D-erythritol 2,4-cyclodiphosphate synthase [Tianweitania sp. BSSL-BM11]|uniref:Bifunctional enzyme IspD/IspF n=1 Tax=Tianweitania aestuarii TaxID=2814886 RepID=A0ABS5RTP5_9HYPH|nr:bifunctional 2-C-methyl-D-erythritol 4-phosphate cytidylyltransferase/2-C-methyl-D-erythritol 2,4-cyclodiphosphate synthase [Tianweitania aestuarii]MBS9720415.1 bifunctional 2-C-methyl-D-erythritol 4-phosphate cytidylyltransferase/2-C-methyl-D-erythritol 2,4-cyclodiphosphate synthase [Tianweitania aestuarii]